MNIKSLLLGSAAALVAVSGARAADAIEVVAEPEPVEYVRICDTYGTGFYYIPGTETCLRVGGYVRYDIGVGSLGHENVLDKKTYLESGLIDLNDTYYKRTRLSVILDARTETELGTLRAFGQFHFNYGSGKGDAYLAYEPINAPGVDVWYQTVHNSQSTDLNHAYIELGGFRIGHTDSIFDSWTGGGTVNNDGLVAYAPASRSNQIRYTFDAGNGFMATLALEAPTDAASRTHDDSVDEVTRTAANLESYALDSYMPNVAAGIGYAAGWGGIKVVGGYDAVFEEYAVKGRIDVNANEQLSAYVMAGWKSNDDTNPLDGQYNYYGQWEGDWAVWGGLSYKATDKATLNFDVGYDDGENLAVVAGLGYTVVPGFTVAPEIVYQSWDAAPGVDDDSWGANIRFQRDF